MLWHCSGPDGRAALDEQETKLATPRTPHPRNPHTHFPAAPGTASDRRQRSAAQARRPAPPRERSPRGARRRPRGRPRTGGRGGGDRGGTGAPAGARPHAREDLPPSLGRDGGGVRARTASIVAADAHGRRSKKVPELKMPGPKRRHTCVVSLRALSAHSVPTQDIFRNYAHNPDAPNMHSRPRTHPLSPASIERKTAIHHAKHHSLCSLGSPRPPKKCPSICLTAFARKLGLGRGLQGGGSELNVPTSRVPQGSAMDEDLRG